MTLVEPARRRRIGIDNHGLFPLGLSPLETLRWARNHGAEGVAFSGLTDDRPACLEPSALADLRAFADANGLYLEWGGAQHIPRDMTTWARKDLADINRRAAREAQLLGTRIVRSCSGGLMRWSRTSPPTSELLRDTADALRVMAPMLRDRGVVLAIETHFEFTSFELLRVFDMCEAGPGDWLGICLDTMNLLTMLEHPVWATERLLPWVVSTHIKDGGVLIDRAGLTTFPVPLGHGVIDIGHIVDRLDTLPTPIHLSVEDHGGSFHASIHDPSFLEQFPDLTGAELAGLVALSEATVAHAACRPTDRAEWPLICEARIAGDLDMMRVIAGRAAASPGDLT